MTLNINSVQICILDLLYIVFFGRHSALLTTPRTWQLPRQQCRVIIALLTTPRTWQLPRQQCRVIIALVHLAPSTCDRSSKSGVLIPVTQSYPDCAWNPALQNCALLLPSDTSNPKVPLPALYKVGLMNLTGGDTRVQVRTTQSVGSRHRLCICVCARAYAWGGR